MSNGSCSFEPSRRWAFSLSLNFRGAAPDESRFLRQPQANVPTEDELPGPLLERPVCADYLLRAELRAIRKLKGHTRGNATRRCGSAVAPEKSLAAARIRATASLFLVAGSVARHAVPRERSVSLLFRPGAVTFGRSAPV